MARTRMSRRPKRNVKRRRFNMTSRRQRIPSQRQSKVFYKRTFWSRNWTPGTAATTDFWKYFEYNLGALPNRAELGAIYDEAKINAIKIKMIPRYDNFAGNDTTDTTLPGVTNQGSTKVHVVIDPKTTSVPAGTYTATTLNDFLEQGNVRTYDGTKPVTIYFKPSIGNYLFSGQQQFTSSRYISVNDTSTNHRGVHVFLQDINLTGTFNQSFDVFVTFYMTLRGMK